MELCWECLERGGHAPDSAQTTVGVFAGNAFLDLDVEFVELPQLKTFANRKFQTSSSAWQGVFSAMTPKQVEAVSKEIMAEVAGD